MEAVVFVQVAEYCSNKEEARRAKLADEQAELDDMHRKQAEEDVCHTVSPLYAEPSLVHVLHRFSCT